MTGIWVVGEPGPDGGLARISGEVATVARELAATADGEVTGVVVAADPARIADDLAAFVPRVVSIADASAANVAWSVVRDSRRTEPSPNRNCTPPTWGEPQFSL